MPAVRRLLSRSAGRLALAATLAAGWAASAGAAPATAPQLVTYISGYATSKPEVVLANVDGTQPRALGRGSAALLSPDGSRVAALDTGANSTLSVYSSAGGEPLTLYGTNQFMQLLGWSPDSRLLLVAVGTTHGQLLAFDVGANTHATVASGAFKGASFEPGGSDAIVYASANATGSAVNLFITTPAGTPTHQLTHDNRSEFPVWGRRGIVYSRLTPGAEGTTPALQLWFIKPGGAGMRQLTDMHMPNTKFTGLTPIAFSANGEHLLANLVGPNWYEAYAVDLTRAKAAPRDLTASNGGTIGDAISANGAFVLATRGSLSDQGALAIEMVRWNSGRPAVLAKNGAYASWDR